VRANFTGGRELTWLKFLPNGNERGQTGGFFQQLLAHFVNVRDAIGDLPPLAVRDGGDEAPYAGPPKSDYQRRLRILGGHPKPASEGHLKTGQL
jgi:hypothetical protein